MSDSEVLSQDEVDSLLQGVSDGDVEIETAPAATIENPQPYDFAYPTHKLQARLPVLDIINDKFCKSLTPALTAFLHQPVEVSIVDFGTSKYLEYTQKLPASVSINRIRLDPLPGSSLICLEGTLVFTLVDCFFGGQGQSAGNPGTREFTPTERRIVERTLQRALESLKSAWETYFPVEPEYVREDTNTHVTNQANPAEVMIVSRFKVKLEQGEGEIHIAIPYASLEPAHSALIATMDEADHPDQSWSMEFTDRVIDANVELQGIIGEAELSLGDLMNLKSGDFIPLGQGNQVTFYSEQIPLFEASVGASNGMISAQLAGQDVKYQQ